MNEQELTTHLRTHFGWRIGPHTARYIAARLESASTKPFPILVTDARTGLPLRETLQSTDLQKDHHQARLF